MTIRSAFIYWLICDKCGASSTGLDGATSRPALIAAAQTYGWTLRATEHRCPTCSQPRHDATKHELP